MVDATLAELVGGEMLFPGRTTDRQDREARIKQMRRLFDEAISAVRRGDHIEARACLDGLRFQFDVAVSVHAERTEAKAKKEG